MADKVVSPIYPVPSWFFTDVLQGEGKSASRIMAAFIKESLESGAKEIPASFMDIQNWTGLVPPRVAFGVKTLREKGYLQRVKRGRADTKTGKHIKAVYQINWDYKERGVETRIRDIFQRTSTTYPSPPPSNGEHGHINAHIAKLVKPGDRVRVGRFGKEEREGWYRVGYAAVRERVAQGPVGLMLRKIADGNLDVLNSRDLLSFWEYRYQARYSQPYIPMVGKDLGILNKLRKVVNNGQIIRMIRWLFDSNQTQFVKPSMGVLGGRLVSVIHTKSVDWIKRTSPGSTGG